MMSKFGSVPREYKDSWEGVGAGGPSSKVSPGPRYGSTETV